MLNLCPYILCGDNKKARAFCLFPSVLFLRQELFLNRSLPRVLRVQLQGVFPFLVPLSWPSSRPGGQLAVDFPRVMFPNLLSSLQASS